MTKRKKLVKFEVGDRVIFDTSGDPIDRSDAAGTIVKIRGALAIIRPDVPIDGTATVTAELLRKLRKETAD